MELMTVDEVGDWLRDNGFSEEVVDCFSDQEMDGMAVIQTLDTNPGPDCLKDIIHKFGLRVKIYTAFKNFNSKKEGEPSTPASSKELGSGMSSVSELSFSEEEVDAPVTPQPETKKEKKLGKRRLDLGQVSQQNVQVPQPFPIPKFRESTEQNLMNKRIADDDRKYINSWKHFIYTRCQNINRRIATGDVSSQPCKRVRSEPQSRSYAEFNTNNEDSTSIERNIEILKKEVSKNKPKLDVMLALMKRTISIRRKEVLDKARPSDMIEKYPHLRKAIYLFHEFDLVVNKENSLEIFKENWEMWKAAIIDYAKASQNKPKSIQEALKGLVVDNSENESLVALRCLAFHLVTKSRKGDKTSDNTIIPHFLMENVRGTPIMEAVDGNTNQPHMLMFVDDGLPSQYFIAVEQTNHTEVANVVDGIFLLLGLHYIYDMRYNVRLQDLYLFFEEKILQIASSCKKSATYSNITSAIECYLD